MIKKIKKPSARDFRPIALLNVSYKIYMSFIREEIENHLRRNNQIRDNQIGFTEGGRIEYNHFILQYIVEKIMKGEELEEKFLVKGDKIRIDSKKVNKIELVVVALDYKKAYDSIDRKSLIETLIKYKIDPIVIDLIAKMYRKDKTKIKMLGVEEEIDITSGIRQGCTVSMELFKLVTYEIIRKLEEQGNNLIIEGANFSSLFFADDNLMITRSVEEAEENIRIITKISKEFGLEINESKSKVLIYKKVQKEDINKVGGIEVVRSLRYLGLEGRGVRGEGSKGES
ncbi:unnamed protein product [Meganyctiphanes norvegica]|uniref:Reverse transcriptase domain-containing protein n=1 Tax=Meganyctiphanes norvegica TaxID=48144 RepID=A0AAV2S5M5_MEGNR